MKTLIERAHTPWRWSFLAAMPAFLVASHAMAARTTFSGQDNSASITGPFPNSVAAAAAFQSAAATLAPMSTFTFEDQPVGFNTSFAAALDVTVSLNAPDWGVDISGIANSTYGELYGFNTTPAGANWLGFPGGSATFSFANPTASFGFWYTVVQSIFTTSLTVTFNDGSAQTLNVPINVNGSASFFGFADPGASIRSVTIANIGQDAWGIDDVSYNLSVVPEPSTYLAGLLLVLPFAFHGIRRLRES